MKLRAPLPLDTPALLDISVSTGLFEAQDADGLLGDVLRRYHAGQLRLKGRELAWHCSAVWRPKRTPREQGS